MNRRLTCIYDAFRFGLWAHSPLYQAGVGRFILSMARELAQREDVRLVLLSPAGLEHDVAAFLQSDAVLRDVEFLRFETRLGLVERLKPLVVRCGNRLLPPRLKTDLKNRFAGGMLAGYREQRPALRYAAAKLVAQGPTCYFSPYYEFPAWLDGIAGLVRAAYIHDIIPLRLPKLHLGDKYYLAWMTRFAEQAELLLCNSHFTRDDFLDWFPTVEAERVVVAPEGCDARFRPQAEETVLTARRKYGIPDGVQYIQTLCTLEARKGLEDVIAAFALYVERGGADDLRLVISGAKGWGSKKLLEMAESLGERIVLTGFVEDADLPALLSGCLCFAYMSRYEGFGLPPLEAMNCGAPVVAARATALPEVVGEGGVLLDAGDVEGLVAVFGSLVGNHVRRDVLREAGLRQARRFSWTRCADIAVEAMRRRLDMT